MASRTGGAARVAILALAAVACGPSASASPSLGPVSSPTGSLPAATSAAASPGGSPAAGLGEPVARIPLPGTAPAAIAVAGPAELWVYSIESGDVSQVSIASSSVTGTTHIGGLGSHVLVGPEGTAYVARFDSGDGSAQYLLAIDPTTHLVTPVLTRPLGGLTIVTGGPIVALEKAGRLVAIDPTTLESVASLDVQVLDEHMEVVAARDVAFVSSDHTPLQRVSVPGLRLEKTIDVGGGVPFVFEGDLVWGARPGALWSLDSSTNQVTRTIALPDVIEVLAMDVAGDEAWLGVRLSGRVGAVLRVDLASGQVTGTAPVGLPAAVRILDDRVWVADYLGNELLAFKR